MQIKQRRETRHIVFNVKTKKSRHEENSLHDNADAGRADRIGWWLRRRPQTRLSRTSPHQRQRSASGLSPTDGLAASPNVRPRMRLHLRRAAQSLAHTLLRQRTRTDSEQSRIGPRTAGEPRTENPCALIELRQQPHRLSYPRCGC